MKYNRPHHCSSCGQIGHRADSQNCRKAKKRTKHKKKNTSKLDKATIYAPKDKKLDHITIRKFKQATYPEVCKLSEAESKAKLAELNLPFKPMKIKQRKCWKCSGKLKRKDDKTARCMKRNCDKKISTSPLLYTPLAHMKHTGKVSYNMYLRAIYTYKTPQDAYRHYLGTKYENT